MGLQKFPLPSFRGGINLKDGVSSLQPHELLRATNVDISSRGVISQRKGIAKLNAAGWPVGKVAENCRNWYTSAARRMMYSIDGKIYSMPTSGELTERFAGTAGTIWCFEDMEKVPGQAQLWMMNGTDKPQKWNGTVWAEWGGNPPNGTMCKVWKNCMFVAGDKNHPQRLFKSAIGDPENPNDVTNGGYGENWIDVRTSEDDVQPITWLEVIGETLFVFKKNGTFAMLDPTSMSFRRVADVGCEDRFQSAVMLDRCYFLHRTGVYSLSAQGGLEYESYKVEPIFREEGETTNVNLEQISKARLLATPWNSILVALPTNGSATNNFMLEGFPNWKNRYEKIYFTPWCMHTVPAASLSLFRPAGLDIVVGGHATIAEAIKIFSGTDDLGVNIASDFMPAWRGFIESEPHERLRRINMYLEGNVMVEVYRDYEAAATYTKEVVGGVGKKVFSRVRPETWARYHAIRFKGLGPAWKIQDVEMAFRGGKEE